MKICGFLNWLTGISATMLSEYFYFCLQNRDMLMEWRKMYLDSQQDTGEVSADDEGVV